MELVLVGTKLVLFRPVLACFGHSWGCFVSTFMANRLKIIDFLEKTARQVYASESPTFPWKWIHVSKSKTKLALHPSVPSHYWDTLAWALPKWVRLDYLVKSWTQGLWCLSIDTVASTDRRLLCCNRVTNYDKCI